MAKPTVAELVKTVAVLEARVATLEAQASKTVVARATTVFAPSQASQLRDRARALAREGVTTRVIGGVVQKYVDRTWVDA